MRPDDRKYTKTHEWVKLDGELATIGITPDEILGRVVEGTPLPLRTAA